MMEKAISSMCIDEVKSVYRTMKENGAAAEVLRLSIENGIHRQALAIAGLSEADRSGRLKQLLALTFQAAREEFCAKATTVTVLQNVFDVVSIRCCEQLFDIVEENLGQWKLGIFHEPCKNIILRMCNDLLKRLSRTVNTGFCGRILVLLAKALPLCEKSGLNLISHFNVENVTKYETVDCNINADISHSEESMEIGEILEQDSLIDHTLYTKFWSLQSYFSSPSICFDRVKWKTFQQNMTDVLSVLNSHKLESCPELPKKRRKNVIKYLQNDMDISDANVSEGVDSYFAKYLTNQKLLQLQLNDSMFRRYFLVQCLILNQYLVSDIKFKDKSSTLNDEQLRFVIESTEKCFQLLRETHPKGTHFAESIKAILQREKEWSEWKNKGCADYTQLADKEKSSLFRKRPRVKYNPKKIDMGNPELTKLWNINPDMLAFCEDSTRNFIPSMVNFLEDPLDEMDPNQQVEEQYKSVNNELFQWQASRLLMSNSPLYFQANLRKPEVTTNIAPFLVEVIKQTALSIPELKDRVPVAKVEVKKTHPGVSSHNGEKQVETSPFVTDAQIEQLAPLLAENCGALAIAMDIERSRSHTTNEPTREVRSLLTHWRNKEGSAATIRKISSLLLKAELFSEQNTPKKLTGGVETHVYFLAQCLLRFGHKVIVITHAYGDRMGIRYLSNKLKVYYLPFIVIYNGSTLPSIVGSLYWYRKIYLQEAIQIVHGHATFSTMAHEALIHAWCLGLHTTFTDHSLFGFADASAILMNELVLRYSLANVDRVICVSYTSKENTVLRSGVPPDKVAVIPNAIATELFLPNEKLFYGNPTTVVVLSRLVYRKGADILVRIIPHVCATHPSVRFIVGGDGPKRVDVEEMREKYRLQERVMMLGTLPHDQVRDVLVQGQIFLNTSLTEAFCMSIVEAASCGLHVVSTRVGGIPEVLPEEFIITAMATPEDLSAALLKAISLRESGQLMAPRARHSAITRMYHWPEVALRTVHVYRSACSRPKQSWFQHVMRYAECGIGMGILYIWAALVNMIFITILEYFNPIEILPECNDIVSKSAEQDDDDDLNERGTSTNDTQLRHRPCRMHLD